METRIISVWNNKGGVGKTTTCINVLQILSELGFKVLGIDMDSQGNMTDGLNVNEYEHSTSDALQGRCPLPLIKVRENLYISPANKKMIHAELILQADLDLFRLKNLLNELDDFDFIIIDCPPSDGVLTKNALHASMEVLVPMQPEKFSQDGMRELLETCYSVKNNGNPNLNIVKGFFNSVRKIVLHRDIMETAEDQNAIDILKTCIRDNVAIKESIMFGQGVNEYDPKSNGAIDFSNLVNEIVNG